MAMSEQYPFSFDWTGYSGSELLKAARGDLNGLDRDDLTELVKELAERYETWRNCD